VIDRNENGGLLMTRPGRWVGVVAVATLVSVLAACGSSPSAAPGPVSVATRTHPTTTAHPTTTVSPTPTTPVVQPLPALPFGGQQWFPQHRVVAYYGSPGTSSLGVLGAASAEVTATRVAQVAAGYRSPGTTVVPAFELIATVADRRPGPDGSYSHMISAASVASYLATARAHHMVLILDVQPGRANFLPVVQRWAGVLAQPDVGLGLDAEWRMTAGQVPGHSIGHVGAAEVNNVTAWLANFVRTRHLPQKLLVMHQFTHGMITDPDDIVAHPELAMVQHLDGFGTRAQKLAKYRSLVRPAQFSLGFKLFYKQDVKLMAPADVLALKPQPAFVSYE
jgi:hypothetical protein